MRKSTMVLLLAVLLASPAFSIGWELGMHATVSPSTNTGREGDTGGVKPIIGFHVGVSPWAILYASWDSLMLPSFMIENMTGRFRPGFLNLFDGGLRLVLGPVVFFTEVGVNNIYVYRQVELGEEGVNWGANLRLGLGLKFRWWGITVTGTEIFPSFQDMGETLRQLGSEENRNWALNKLKDGLIPSLMAVIYF